MDDNEKDEFEIDFTDSTILEAEGRFDRVKEIMSKDVAKQWMLETTIFLNSSWGEAEMLLHLYYNGDVYIMGFIPSPGMTDYSNPDISYLSFWAQSCGWNIPQPFPDLVRNNMEFWKHFWSTGMVNSDFLDKKFGKRPQDEDPII